MAIIYIDDVVKVTPCRDGTMQLVGTSGKDTIQLAMSRATLQKGTDLVLRAITGPKPQDCKIAVLSIGPRHEGAP